jgi:hypothetical protein
VSLSKFRVNLNCSYNCKLQNSFHYSNCPVWIQHLNGRSNWRMFGGGKRPTFQRTNRSVFAACVSCFCKLISGWEGEYSSRPATLMGTHGPDRRWSFCDLFVVAWCEVFGPAREIQRRVGTEFRFQIDWPGRSVGRGLETVLGFTYSLCGVSLTSDDWWGRDQKRISPSSPAFTHAQRALVTFSDRRESRRLGPDKLAATVVATFFSIFLSLCTVLWYSMFKVYT